LTPPRSLLVFHTAFPGDIILVLPLIQVLQRAFPDVPLTVVTTPAAAGLLAGHPAVSEVLPYDKRGERKGVRGILSMASLLRERRFEAALIPHRSFRSGLVCRLAGIPVRIGFETSAARFLMTATVPYVRADHEILRNLSLGMPLGIRERKMELPSLYPSREDRSRVESFLEKGIERARGIVAVAPGSVWNTKRWPEDSYAALVAMLRREGHPVVLVGGEADIPLCGRVARAGEASGGALLDASGKFTLLQSAALIERCAVLVSNDSAPMHMGVAVRTPVVALFGATVPAFGFSPVGAHDKVVETDGLACRPCAIHGGPRCPIGTFECMNGIHAARVRDEVVSLIAVRKN
jgi:heptosyltransferase-2